MATDYAEMEREFIASLVVDTGKSLEEWMAAIAASGLTDRNDVIDWLRHRGFHFSRASWIERIHHNGGRLIYAGGTAAVANRGASDEPPGRPAFEEPPRGHPAQLAPSRQTGDIAALLGNAKGLRPLADLVVRELAAAAPDVHLETRAQLIVASRKHPFAALWPQPKKLRLYADFGPGGALDVRTAEPVNKAPAPFPRMLLLDDARRIDTTFRAAVVEALKRAGA